MMKKGQAETPFILALVIFLAFTIFLTTQIAPRYPQYQVISSFDFAYLGGGLIGVAGACAIATGLACAGALVIFNVLSFFLVSNTLIGTLIFTPLTVVVAYVVSRLAKGGG